MKTHLHNVLLFIQLFEACADVVFKRLTENQSLVVSCIPQQQHGHLVGLHLYHRGPQKQTTLLSVAEGTTVRMDPVLGARLQLNGGLKSPVINVSISQLQLSDTGLYMWELSYRQKNSSDQIILGPQKYLLLVKGEGRSCPCSHGYIPLLLTISAAAGLLLLTICLLAIEKCVRLRHPPLPPHSPIYEEMSRKQQSAGSPKINHEASPRADEVDFPVYANPNIRQPQDNYYACPRQLAVRV